MFLLASLLTFKLICAYKKNEKGEAFFFLLFYANYMHCS